MKCKNPFAFRPCQVTFWTTIIYLGVFIPLLFVHETVPPAPKDRNLYRGLNLTEAWLDLQTITTNYHPYNSHANDRVRDFLVDRSKEILVRNGVKYSVHTGTAEDGWSASETDTAANGLVTLFDDLVSNFTRTEADPRWVKTGGTYFEAKNYYIYLRGKQDPAGPWWSTKTGYEKLRKTGGVLVNCHFDSVSTGFGATDDGMGCVTMLQLLSYFTSSENQPENGIILLFNDAEEDGLLGANAFIKSPVWQFAHTFVNLEGAGAGGRAMLFRATDLEVAKAYSRSPHPFGSIVAADSFKTGVIRSGTDYSVFENIMGQRGLDIAFYAPRSRYHTDQDDARHASVNSIWHMLSAALESTERLAQTTSSTFTGDRPDGDGKKVQNGRPTKGVWFDMFGSALAALELRGLFAWSLTLLIATPLILILVSYLLARKDKYYLFARDIKIHSEHNDDPVKLGGWKGCFRFPLALVFAGGLTIASVLLIAKFNPLIIYSSPYAVWSMTLSLFYFAFWLIMRGSSFVRPSALHRAYANIWLFTVGWALQVLAAVAEDRWNIGSLYWAAFLHTAIFLSLFISLLELSALPGKHSFAHQIHDAHQTRDAQYNRLAQQDGADDDDGEDEDEEQEDATETTPLRSGDQGYGANSQTTTFASTYRQSVSEEPQAETNVPRRQPYLREQSWSGHLPQWTWIIQFLLLAPMPLILIGNLGLVAMSSLGQTGADGSDLWVPLQAIGILSIFLLLPMTPFIHRVTHHIPVFLLAVFVGTFIYSLTAFPFSIQNRYKFYFQQTIDLDEGSNVVRLSGLEEFIRPIINSLPSASSQKVECDHSGPKAGQAGCEYDASSLTPNLVEGKKLGDLIFVAVPDHVNSSLVTLSIDAVDTRMCVLTMNRPVYDFSVQGGSPRDNRLGALPENGFESIDIWRRKFDGPWNVTLNLEKKTRANDSKDPTAESSDEESAVDELRVRSHGAFKDEPLEVTVNCKWSDANKPDTIPALQELRQFMPPWSAVTKSQVGLVEVKKKFQIGQ